MFTNADDTVTQVYYESKPAVFYDSFNVENIDYIRRREICGTEKRGINVFLLGELKVEGK